MDTAEIFREEEEDEMGVVCSNSDLRSILSGRDVDFDRTGHRRSLTMTRKGFKIKGFLSQEAAKARLEELKVRRGRLQRATSLSDYPDPGLISEVFEVNKHGSKVGSEKQSSKYNPLARKTSCCEIDCDGVAASGGKPISPAAAKSKSRLEKSRARFGRSRQVSWDGEMTIDPTMIGNVIETYLKKDKLNQVKETDDEEAERLRRLRHEASKFGRSSVPNACPTRRKLKQAERSKSVDVTEQGRIIIVDEMDRPRKNSLRCSKSIDSSKIVKQLQGVSL